MPLFALLIIFISIAIVALWLLNAHQKRLEFVHPGWILVITILFYGLPTPLVWVVNAAALLDIAPELVGRDDQEAIFSVLLMYVLSLVGFVSAQALIFFQDDKNRRSHRSVVRSNTVRATPIRFAIAVCGVVGLYLFYLNYQKVGGYIAFLSFGSRSDAVELLSIEEGYTRYQLVFLAMFVLWISLACIVRNRRRSIILAISAFVYALVILSTGSRLPVLVLSLAMLFVVYVSAREVLLRYRLRVIMVASVALIGFSLYGTLRADVRYYLAYGEWQPTTLSVIDLYPSETTTGYLPGLVFESVGWDQVERNYIGNFIPASFYRLVGSEKEEPVARVLARSMRGYWGRGVQTVTMPVDMYAGSNMFGVWVLSLVVYLLLYIVIRVVYRYGVFGMGCSAIVFANCYYVVRVESANWFGRLWQSLAIFVVLWCICYCVSAVYSSVRRKEVGVS